MEPYLYHVSIYTVAYVETFPDRAVEYDPCSKDEHYEGCSSPDDLTDIPKENCPCPVTADEHVKDPRKDGICRYPQKGIDEFKTDPRTKVKWICYVGVTRTALLMVMMTLIMPILVQYLFWNSELITFCDIRSYICIVPCRFIRPPLFIGIQNREMWVRSEKAVFKFKFVASRSNGASQRRRR
ncbi:MAG: hypothetical protein EZS28_035262 [Streblomastix strix]|uniref:Uncharacterized protein n=1 Tax=Streblomastix strix TaxID=222440 RepID=A0A5J4UGM4_9EUKA|nr:MAG: hypothetical protein EZS28_035262 [Streblomastix strix]